MRGNSKSCKGANLTVVEGRHHFVPPAWYLFIILVVDSMLGVVYNTIFSCGIQRVTASWRDILHESQSRTFQPIGVTVCMQPYTCLFWHKGDFLCKAESVYCTIIVSRKQTIML